MMGISAVQPEARRDASVHLVVRISRTQSPRAWCWQHANATALRQDTGRDQLRALRDCEQSFRAHGHGRRRSLQPAARKTSKPATLCELGSRDGALSLLTEYSS